MIADSVPWKDELLKVAADLARRKTQARWTDRSQFLFDRNVMTSAYSVRKLIEARKVSDALVRKSWPVTRFEPIGHLPDVWNRGDTGSLFDLSSPVRVSLSTLLICHQIIHSYIFVPVWDWNQASCTRRRLQALQFVSDKNRETRLYSIEIDKLIELFAEVGDEEVIRTTIRRDDRGASYISEVIGVGRADGRHWSHQGGAEGAVS